MTLRRDTQREDEIKSIKAAWEELQPGRAAKVNVTNLTSIKSNTSATMLTFILTVPIFQLSINAQLNVRISRQKRSEKSILPGKLRRKPKKARKKSPKKSRD